ncbi:MAG: BlaI/MecI/CopY family transcriptional regulator [Leucobacter sp.]
MNHDTQHTHAIPEYVEPTRLGTLETQVMELLWEGEPLTVRNVIARLPSEPAYTTIATVLSNLRKKDLVCTQKDGHATLYRACLSREEHAARIMEHAVDTSGDRAASILRFVSSMPDDDLDLLRNFLSGRDHGDS